MREYEKSHLNGKHTPIIAISGNVQPSEQAAYMQAGMDSFLAKPFKKDEFLRIIAKYMPQPKAVEEVSVVSDAKPPASPNDRVDRKPQPNQPQQQQQPHMNGSPPKTPPSPVLRPTSPGIQIFNIANDGRQILRRIRLDLGQTGSAAKQLQFEQFGLILL